VDNARDFISDSLKPENKEKNHRFLIFLKESGELVGGIALEKISLKYKNAELGYWCAVDHWGKGIVTEASMRVLEYGFNELDLNRIYAICFTENLASARIMEKCGMKYEGTARQEYFKDDKPVDMHHYAILKSEWPPKEKKPICLETERLILRTPKFSDMKDMAVAISSLEISKFSAHIKYPFTIDDAHEWYKQQSWAESMWGHITLLIFLKGTGELVGSILSRVEIKHKKASLAYWIAAKHWKKGFATEACREMIRYGFEELGLEWIAAGIIVENKASIRVVEKLGMKFEGVAFKEWWREDGPIDVDHYVLYREDWRKK
jgi:RimJ/RimL family protein N-acetyltransferase